MAQLRNSSDVKVAAPFGRVSKHESRKKRRRVQPGPIRQRRPTRPNPIVEWRHQPLKIRIASAEPGVPVTCECSRPATRPPDHPSKQTRLRQQRTQRHARKSASGSDIDNRQRDKADGGPGSSNPACKPKSSSCRRPGWRLAFGCCFGFWLYLALSSTIASPQPMPASRRGRNPTQRPTPNANSQNGQTPNAKRQSQNGQQSNANSQKRQQQTPNAKRQTANAQTPKRQTPPPTSNFLKWHSC